MVLQGIESIFCTLSSMFLPPITYLKKLVSHKKCEIAPKIQVNEVRARQRKWRFLDRSANVIGNPLKVAIWFLANLFFSNLKWRSRVTGSWICHVSVIPYIAHWTWSLFTCKVNCFRCKMTRWRNGHNLLFWLLISVRRLHVSCRCKALVFFCMFLTSDSLDQRMTRSRQPVVYSPELVFIPLFCIYLQCEIPSGCIA